MKRPGTEELIISVKDFFFFLRQFILIILILFVSWLSLWIVFSETWAGLESFLLHGGKIYREKSNNDLKIY